MGFGWPNRANIETISSRPGPSPGNVLNFWWVWAGKTEQILRPFRPVLVTPHELIKIWQVFSVKKRKKLWTFTGEGPWRDEIVSIFALFCQPNPIKNWKHYMGRDKDGTKSSQYLLRFASHNPSKIENITWGGTRTGRNSLNICSVLQAKTHQKLRTLPGEGPRWDEIVSIFAPFCKPKHIKNWEHYLGRDQDGTK
jgi:hypothetical protein